MRPLLGCDCMCPAALHKPWLCLPLTAESRHHSHCCPPVSFRASRPRAAAAPAPAPAAAAPAAYRPALTNTWQFEEQQLMSPGTLSTRRQAEDESLPGPGAGHHPLLPWKRTKKKETDQVQQTLCAAPALPPPPPPLPRVCLLTSFAQLLASPVHETCVHGIAGLHRLQPPALSLWRCCCECGGAQ